ISMGILEPDGDPLFVNLHPNLFQTRSDLLLLTQEALGLKVQLFHLIIDKADALTQGVGARVKSLSFLIVGRNIRVFGGLINVLLICLGVAFQLGDHLAIIDQRFRLGIESFKSVATHASAMTESLFAAI